MSIKYRPEIDGLRAVAVLSVIFSHAHFYGFDGGFVGVDVFFVISGYLITRIILEECTAGRFSIIEFYERRARRILPALFFVLLACIPLAWIFLLPAQYEDFSKSLIAASFSVSNFYFWKESDYFSADAAEMPLLHMWSLATEEQYYMLFPLLFLWRLRRKTIFVSVLVLAFSSLIYSEWGSHVFPTANYYLLPGRAWQILAGSICAFYATGRHPRSNGTFALIGLAMIVASVLVFEPSTRTPSVLSLLPVLGTALVLLFALSDTLVGKTLSVPLMRWIGKVSFSAYLWHHPIFAYWRVRSLETPSFLVMGMLILVTFALAAITWHLVEQPFRKIRVSTSRLVFTVSGCVAVFAGLGALGVATEGVPSRTPPKLLAFIENTRWSNNCLLQVEDGIPPLPMEACVFNPGSSENYAIWGDSIGASLAPALAEKLNAQGKGLIQLTYGFCVPVIDLSVERAEGARNCREFNDRALDYLIKSDVKTVVLAGSWVAFFTAGYLKIDDVERPQSSVLVADVQDNISSTITTLQRSGKDVLLVYPGPRFDEAVRDEMAAIMAKGDDTPTFEYSLSEFKKNTARAYAMLDGVSNPALRRVLPEHIFCKDAAANVCLYGRDGVAYVADKVHYTNEGAALVASELLSTMTLNDR